MDDLEVFFCDLCNTSVPESALASGEARRHAGKVIGPCCLGALRAGAVAPAAPKPRVRDSGGARGGFAAALIVLVAVAATAVFLDWRMSVEFDAVADGIDAVDARLTQNEDQIAQINKRIAELPARSEVAELGRGLDGVQSSVDGRVEAVREAIRDSDARSSDLRDLIQEVKDSQVQHAARIALLHDDVREVGRDIAELRAAPRPAAPDPAASRGFEPVTEPVAVDSDAATDGGLPPELAQQVARLGDPDDGVRFEAVDELLQSKDPRVFTHLVPLVKDPDPFVRRLVLEGLADHKTVESVDALLAALLDDEGIVRHTAYESLRKVTGQNLPFDPDASSDQLKAMQRRWQQWWDNNRDRLGFAAR